MGAQVSRFTGVPGDRSSSLGWLETWESNKPYQAAYPLNSGNQPRPLAQG
jgi:hypothetical protein